MKFIELTQIDEKKVSINVDNIIAIYPSKEYRPNFDCFEGTRIDTLCDCVYHVLNKYDDVIKLIAEL